MRPQWEKFEQCLDISCYEGIIGFCERCNNDVEVFLLIAFFLETYILVFTDEMIWCLECT